jgi:hypothetical protein
MSNKSLLRKLVYELGKKGYSKPAIQTVLNYVNTPGVSLERYDHSDWTSITEKDWLNTFNKSTISITGQNFSGKFILSNQFRLVTSPIRAYKKAYYNRIVNLIVPIGSLIYVEPFSYDSNRYKLRTNLCLTHSLWDGVKNETVPPETLTYGLRDGYEYVSNKPGHQPSTIRNAAILYRHRQHINIPNESFSLNPAQCASGIHFFFDVLSAIMY